MKSLLPQIAITLALLAAPSAQAAIRYVNDDAGGANNGTSWADAYADLQSAFNNVSGGDEIWVAGGTYFPTNGTSRSAMFVLKPNVSYYGGFAADESATSQRPANAPASILSGDIGTPGNDSDNTFTIVRADAASAGALIDGFTITKAQNDSGLGGGMQVYGTITVRDCIIEHNTAAEAGAVQNGLRSPNLPSSSLYDRCIFRNNRAIHASAARSGAFQNYNANSAATLQNCLFHGNSSDGSDGRGGALGIYHGSIAIKNCTFAGNTGTGVGDCAYLSNGGHPTFSNCILWDIGDNGGGISVKTGEVLPNTNPIGDINDSDVRGGYSPPGGQGTGVNIMNLDPLFVNAGLNDYHLQSTSPCRDAGTPTGAPNTDLDGGARPIGSGYDMGAYEFGSGAPSTGLILKVR